jgi:hypothetical protein
LGRLFLFASVAVVSAIRSKRCRKVTVNTPPLQDEFDTMNREISLFRGNPGYQIAAGRPAPGKKQSLII